MAGTARGGTEHGPALAIELGGQAVSELGSVGVVEVIGEHVASDRHGIRATSGVGLGHGRGGAGVIVVGADVKGPRAQRVRDEHGEGGPVIDGQGGRG